MIDPDASDPVQHRALTATEVLQAAGMERPGNGQAKEAAAILRERFGESKRINGRDKWRVPLRRDVGPTGLPNDNDFKEKPKSKFD